MNYSKIVDVNDPKGKNEKSLLLEVFIPNDFGGYTLHAGQSLDMKTGLKINIPKDRVLLVVPSKDNVIKKGLFVVAGLIGDKLGKEELVLTIHNVGASHNFLRAGDLVACIASFAAKKEPFELVDEEDLFPPAKEVKAKNTDTTTADQKAKVELERRVKILTDLGFEELPLAYSAEGATITKVELVKLSKTDFGKFVKASKAKFEELKKAHDAANGSGDK